MLNFNIHPLLVHFPIALLVVYSLLEWVPIKKITNLYYWFYIKATFLFLGVLSTIPTGITGKIIENQFSNRHNLVNLHSNFAITASFVYLILAGIYLLAFLNKKTRNKFFLPNIVIILLSIVGFLLISITGALGGIIVYGPDLDPFTSFIYGLFFH